jgi:hypothetical protein
MMMIHRRGCVVAAFVSLLSAASASAASLTPEGPFVADGEMIVSNGSLAACTVRLLGSVRSDGTATVTSAVFAGESPLCHQYDAGSSPWALVPLSVTELSVAGMTVKTPAGVCKMDASASWNNDASILKFDAEGGTCRLIGAFATFPKLSID